ncbi:hypothetical protein V7S43_002531 [Phytophthora oleae]|uniref:RING-type domain-containing protein n=1 Tax=Phytophthora oleae TaxID=2107226 RepID=A0ABD3FYJ8_9STRA
MVNASPPADDGGSPTCSADVHSSPFSQDSGTHTDPTGGSPVRAEFRPEGEHLPILIEERVRGLLGEPLSDVDCASVQLTPQRPCRSGEIVAVTDSDGVLRYGKVREEPNGEEVKVQVSKACIKWYAVSQIYFFQAMGRNLAALNDGWAQDKELQDKGSILAEVNALLARLNVSLSTSYEELLAEIFQLQHRAALADEDHRAALKQLQQALREKRDAEKALTCVVCLVNAVDCVLIPCGHSYCSPCVDRLHRDLCPVCRHEIMDSAAFRFS